VHRYDFPNACIEIPREEVARTSARLLASVPIVDLSIQDPPIEEVIGRAFEDGGETPVETGEGNEA
jgi:ABC-2 type transport system ATP-binding protein